MIEMYLINQKPDHKEPALLVFPIGDTFWSVAVNTGNSHTDRCAVLRRIKEKASRFSADESDNFYTNYGSMPRRIFHAT